MRLNITKRDIALGWERSRCPIHRAIKRATGYDGTATLDSVGYYQHNRVVYLRCDVAADWTYLKSVMAYADGQIPDMPRARRIKVTSTE